MARAASWIELASGNGLLKGATAACMFTTHTRQFFVGLSSRGTANCGECGGKAIIINS